MAGRKDRYKEFVEPYLDKIPDWTVNMTEDEIAHKLGISRTTFTVYKQKHPELVAALHLGRTKLCQALKDTLRKKALGFTYTETKTTKRRVGGGKLEVTVETFDRYAQPDTGAIHLLLKNFDPAWRNDDASTAELKKQQVEIAKQKAEQSAYD